jgi:tRNA pseudouridine38-40 synthase
MIELAAAFAGEHDFTVFAAADDRDAEGRSKVRTIFSSELARSGDLLIYRVRGSGFLKHMVRNITGTLIEAGKGNVADLAVLPAKCGPTAPAKGLLLVNVEY